LDRHLGPCVCQGIATSVWTWHFQGHDCRRFRALAFSARPPETRHARCYLSRRCLSCSIQRQSSPSGNFPGTLAPTTRIAGPANSTPIAKPETFQGRSHQHKTTHHVVGRKRAAPVRPPKKPKPIGWPTTWFRDTVAAVITWSPSPALALPESGATCFDFIVAAT